MLQLFILRPYRYPTSSDDTDLSVTSEIWTASFSYDSLVLTDGNSNFFIRLNPYKLAFWDSFDSFGPANLIYRNNAHWLLEFGVTSFLLHFAIATVWNEDILWAWILSWLLLWAKVTYGAKYAATIEIRTATIRLKHSQCKWEELWLPLNYLNECRSCLFKISTVCLSTWK